jgi:hypothetical protein
MGLLEKRLGEKSTITRTASMKGGGVSKTNFLSVKEPAKRAVATLLPVWQDASNECGRKPILPHPRSVDEGASRQKQNPIS